MKLQLEHSYNGDIERTGHDTAEGVMAYILSDVMAVAGKLVKSADQFVLDARRQDLKAFVEYFNYIRLPFGHTLRVSVQEPDGMWRPWIGY